MFYHGTVASCKWSVGAMESDVVDVNSLLHSLPLFLDELSHESYTGTSLESCNNVESKSQLTLHTNNFKGQDGHLNLKSFYATAKALKAMYRILSYSAEPNPFSILLHLCTHPHINQ